jgi:hypothetical protein
MLLSQPSRSDLAMVGEGNEEEAGSTDFLNNGWLVASFLNGKF